MKSLTAVFGAGVIGIVFCLIMTIYTGVQESKQRNEPVPLTIPTPALGN
jgi:hypothetical protein